MSRQTRLACQPRVISVGTLPELLSLRHAVLEGAGFQVFTTSSLQLAILRIEEGDCGVLLICYSVDSALRKELIHRYRESCAGGRVVALTNTPMDRPQEADTLLYGVDGAEALIAAVRGDKPN